MTPNTDVILTCRPGRTGNALQFACTVANGSNADVYLLDAFPAVDPKTRQAFADPNGAYVGWLGGETAYVLKGIPPLPRDRTVAVRIIPLGSRVAPGTTLERTFTVPLPLAEQSPYFGDLPLRQYEQVEITNVIVAVQFIRSTAPGFVATPAEFNPAFFRVQTRHTVQDAETLTSSFPTKGLVLLKRTDNFARPEPLPH
jgi:hypothetical protein